MRLLEDKSKALLRKAGLPVPRGELARSADEASRLAKALAGPEERVAIKALVAAGRRGKAGAVAVCKPAEAAEAAARILSLTLDQKQVEYLYVEEAIDIADEYYLAFAFGDLGPRVVASLRGGVDIEAVAHESPKALVNHDIDPVEGLRSWQAAALWDQAGAPSDQIPRLSALTVSLYAAFRDNDSQMLEINPLVRTTQGDWAVVGTMMEIDDNALFRHPAWQAQADETAGPGGRRGYRRGPRFRDRHASLARGKRTSSRRRTHGRTGPARRRSSGGLQHQRSNFTRPMQDGRHWGGPNRRNLRFWTNRRVFAIRGDVGRNQLHTEASRTGRFDRCLYGR